MDQLGLETLALIDVGSRWGIHPRWGRLANRLQVIGFEPDPDECRRLNRNHNGKAAFYPVALSDKPGREILRIAREVKKLSGVTVVHAFRSDDKSPEAAAFVQAFRSDKPPVLSGQH